MSGGRNLRPTPASTAHVSLPTIPGVSVRLVPNLQGTSKGPRSSAAAHGRSTQPSGGCLTLSCFPLTGAGSRLIARRASGPNILRLAASSAVLHANIKPHVPGSKAASRVYAEQL